MEYGLQLSKTALARRCELVQTSLADMDELLSLKLDVRNLVLDRLDALREILLSKSPNKACMEIAYRKEREGAKGWSYKKNAKAPKVGAIKGFTLFIPNFPKAATGAYCGPTGAEPRRGCRRRL